MRGIFAGFVWSVHPALVDLGSVCVLNCKLKVRKPCFVSFKFDSQLTPVVQIDKSNRRQKKQITFSFRFCLGLVSSWDPLAMNLTSFEIVAAGSTAGHVQEKRGLPAAHCLRAVLIRWPPQSPSVVADGHSSCRISCDGSPLEVRHGPSGCRTPFGLYRRLAFSVSSASSAALVSSVSVSSFSNVDRHGQGQKEHTEC